MPASLAWPPDGLKKLVESNRSPRRSFEGDVKHSTKAEGSVTTLELLSLPVTSATNLAFSGGTAIKSKERVNLYYVQIGFTLVHSAA